MVGEGRRQSSRWLDLIIGLQLVALIAFGILTVARFPVWSPIDEGAHYAYVQQIAEHGRLPVLGKTQVSEQVMAITAREGTARLRYDPFARGLGTNSYEAFQPPLYYALVAPVFAAVPGYLNKVYALRAFDLLLFLIGAALALQLCRSVLPRRWRLAAPLVLATLMLPGVVVRSITISNEALELPLALLFLLLFVWGWDKPSGRRLLVLSAVLGACLLTQLLLVVLVPLWVAAGWRWWRESRNSRPHVIVLRTLVLAAVVPAVLVIPWLGYNEAHYHALTAQRLVMKMQLPVVNPNHFYFSLRALPDSTTNQLWALMLPQEWTSDFGVLPRTSLLWVNQASGVLLIPLLGLAMLAAGRKFLFNRIAWLAVPYLGVTVLLWWITYHEQWFAMLPRYTYAGLPAWALAGAVALGVSSTKRLPVALGSGLSLVFLGCWVLLARSYL